MYAFKQTIGSRRIYIVYTVIKYCSCRFVWVQGYYNNNMMSSLSDVSTTVRVELMPAVAIFFKTFAIRCAIS